MGFCPGGGKKGGPFFGGCRRGGGRGLLPQGKKGEEAHSDSPSFALGDKKKKEGKKAVIRLLKL